MSLMSDLAHINNINNLTKETLSFDYFKNLAKKSVFKDYKPETLYRAYILEYILLLWDNTYLVLINKNNRNLKLRGISEHILGNTFINSNGYHKLIKLEYFIENNYFSKYAVIRYLTQAWGNYLYTKTTHYTYIPLNKVYADKVQKQYLALSKGLTDKVVYQDNLSFTDDPVTIALLNYYYYLDTDRSTDLINSFELSLTNSLDKIIKEEYNILRKNKDITMLLNFINIVGREKESFTASYADTLLLNQNTMTFDNMEIQTKANDYLATTSEECNPMQAITLSLSRLGMFKEILKVACKKRLGCNPLDSTRLDKYKQLGFKITTTNKLIIES